MNEKIIIENNEILFNKKIGKIAQVKDEYWTLKEIENPEMYISTLKGKKIKFDIFTFSQKIPNIIPKYPYYFEYDNIAAIKISSFENWWKNQINDKTRNIARKAGKKGVEIKVAEFNDEFVNGIKGIYDETPIRQGRPFWHYKKDFKTVRDENITYSERSDYVGAYFENELIGFIKMVYVGEYANLMQIISKICHRDKSPTNALISKAVEICASKGIKYLTYGSFIYGNKGVDHLTEFKINNGFEKIEVPKYYIPVTLKGKIIIKLSLIHGFSKFIPTKILNFMLDYRTKRYEKKYNIK
jgi:hypothetical protein